MPKVYVVERDRETGTVAAFVEQGTSRHALRHRIRHSPTGFEFGYGGSGPSDLALSMAWDVLGREPHPLAYQALKSRIVAKHAGAGFRVTEEAVRLAMREGVAFADRSGGRHESCGPNGELVLLEGEVPMDDTTDRRKMLLETLDDMRSKLTRALSLLDPQVEQCKECGRGHSENLPEYRAQEALTVALGRVEKAVGFVRSRE
jgi:hypothetical protein